MMMKKRLKSMYDHIELNAQQKNAIWENIDWENAAPEQPQKKSSRNRLLRMALPVAAAFAVVVCSGTAVLATTSTFSVDRIVETLLKRSWRDTEPSEATSEQIELYTQYGDTLGVEIELASGTLYLDDICYDQNFLHIPFRYVPNQELEPGSRSYSPISSKYRFMRKGDGPAEDEFSDHYYFNKFMPCSWYTDPYVQEDGSITGWMRPYLTIDERFSQGDVIQFCMAMPQPHSSRSLEEGEDTTGYRLFNYHGQTLVDTYVPPVVLAEFTLNKTPSVLEIAPELCTGLPEEFKVDSLSLSALSLHISGSIDLESSEDPARKLDCSNYYITDCMTIVMKDGRIIRRGGNGAGGAFNGSDSRKDFSLHMEFQEAIDLDDAEWIHIEGTDPFAKAFAGVDLWVPIHYDASSN